MFSALCALCPSISFLLHFAADMLQFLCFLFFRIDFAFFPALCFSLVFGFNTIPSGFALSLSPLSIFIQFFCSLSLSLFSPLSHFSSSLLATPSRAPAGSQLSPRPQRTECQPPSVLRLTPFFKSRRPWWRSLDPKVAHEPRWIILQYFLDSESCLFFWREASERVQNFIHFIPTR